ncbi:MAG: hypothetical protein WCI77_03830 [Candidatus Omnitrophota bacterium]
MSLLKKIAWLVLGVIFVPLAMFLLLLIVRTFFPTLRYAAEQVFLVIWIGVLSATILLAIIVRKKKESFSNGLLVSAAIALIVSFVALLLHVYNYTKLNYLKVENESLMLKTKSLKEEISGYKKRIKEYEENSDLRRKLPGD